MKPKREPIHPNLERRFVKLATAQSSYRMALGAFVVGYDILFDALAADIGITRKDLARRVGFDPVSDNGNRIMNGEADPSPEDVLMLLSVYMETRP